MTISIPFAVGAPPFLTAKDGAVFEAETVNISHADRISSSGHLSIPKGYGVYGFIYGTVVFSVISTGWDHYPLSLGVTEYWGGSYSMTFVYDAINGSSTWVSPDSLSGVEYGGGYSLTLLVAMSELTYGLPPAPGTALFAATAGVVAYAIFLDSKIRRSGVPYVPP